jgi:archaellum component FlaC
METIDLIKMAKAIYIAADEDIAADISERLNWAADRIEELEKEVERLKGEISTMKETERQMVEEYRRDVR